MGAERVEVVERRARNGGGTRGDLFVGGRLRRRRQLAMPVVGPIDPDDVKMAASVLISRKKSCAAKRPSPSCSGSVLDVAATDTPRSTSWESSREISVVFPGSSSSNSSMHNSV